MSQLLSASVLHILSEINTYFIFSTRPCLVAGVSHATILRLLEALTSDVNLLTGFLTTLVVGLVFGCCLLSSASEFDVLGLKVILSDFLAVGHNQLVHSIVSSPGSLFLVGKPIQTVHNANTVRVLG